MWPRFVTLASASMLWSATSARDSRVNSSTTWRILMVRLVAVILDLPAVTLRILTHRGYDQRVVFIDGFAGPGVCDTGGRGSPRSRAFTG